MRMKKILIFASLLAVLSSCTFKKIFYIDFNKVDYTPEMFHVKSQEITDLAGGYPQDTYLPDGSSVADLQADTKATSFVVQSLAQNLFEWSTQGSVVQISGVYQSTDDKGNPITLSGKLILPTNKPVKRIILVSHYTIGSNAEAPSNSFPLEGPLASMGYALVCPDYIGYGATSDMYHPYLMMELTAKNVIDMYLAVVPFLEAIGKAPQHEDIYLMGYSQGGGTTMAVEYLIERDHYRLSEHPISIKRVFTGGGIYDVKATFESFVDTNISSYPCGVPFVIVGQVKGNRLDDNLIPTLLQPRVTQYLDDWFLKKNTSTSQMNKLLGTKRTDELLTEHGLNRTSTAMVTLYQYMVLNSVLSLAWEPQAPVYMMHSINDDTVPFENATRASVRWQNANIQYNFGEYGTHVMCALRFIFTVKTLLEDDKD